MNTGKLIDCYDCWRTDCDWLALIDAKAVAGWHFLPHKDRLSNSIISQIYLILFSLSFMIENVHKTVHVLPNAENNFKANCLELPYLLGQISRKC